MIQENPIHPSEILRQFLTDYRISTGGLARHIKVPRTRIERIMRKEMGISTDTAMRLAKAFETSYEFWQTLQTNYEVAVTLKQIGWQLEHIVPFVYIERKS